MANSLCKIVLVRPRDPNNIGAAARVMKNFGFTELAVVAPFPPVWEEVVSAVNAEDLLAQTKVYDDLSVALADCTLVVGTVDQTRLAENQSSYTFSELKRELNLTTHQLALVFGSEKNGLTNSEIAYCHQLLSVPTQSDCPSMNLSQAVAICCYELRQERDTGPSVSMPASLATVGEIEIGVTLVQAVLRRTDFVSVQKEAALVKKIRQSLMRFRLTQSEVKLLCGALRQIKRFLPEK